MIYYPLLANKTSNAKNDILVILENKPFTND